MNDDTTWFGRTVGMHQVQQAMYDVLQTWLPTAVADVARQSGIDPHEIPQPVSWARAVDYRDLPMQQSPNVVVGTPQTTARSRGAEGRVDLTWLVNVAAVVRGQDYADTARTVGIYMAAISVVVEQHATGHALINGVSLAGDAEQYDVLSADQQRTIAGGLLRCDVTVTGARQATRVHSTPPEDPYAEPQPLPTVDIAEPEVS